MRSCVGTGCWRKATVHRGQWTAQSPLRQTAPWPKALATLPFPPGLAGIAVSTVVDIAQAPRGIHEHGHKKKSAGESITPGTHRG